MGQYRTGTITTSKSNVKNNLLVIGGLSGGTPTPTFPGTTGSGLVTPTTETAGPPAYGSNSGGSDATTQGTVVISKSISNVKNNFVAGGGPLGPKTPPFGNPTPTRPTMPTPQFEVGWIPRQVGVGLGKVPGGGMRTILPPTPGPGPSTGTNKAVTNKGVSGL